ncbi:MAG TPA: caspase family protein [Asanoa sp.]
MPGRRRALIVANDEYENEGLRHLTSPGADAEALGRVLADARIGDFDVRVIRNEPAHVIGTHIEDLFSDARPDDVLLVHFSCHGLKSESGELFFAAANTRPNRLGSTAVAAGFVQRCMHASRSRSIVLLLDCCYGGAFSQGVAVRAAGDVNVLDSFPAGRLGGGRGRAVITASSSMEYAFEGDRLADDQERAPSVFTSALVEGLASGDADRDEDGWVSLNELYEYVFDQVRERNPNQTPRRDVEMSGELYLARSGRRRIPPQPIPADLRAAMTDANMFSRLGAVTELRSRLASDNLPVAVGAYEALHEIAATDIRYVAEAAAAAMRTAEIQPSSRSLSFGPVAAGDDAGRLVVRLAGPPLARGSVHASDPWIAVADTPDGFAVSVDTSRAGSRRGSVTVKSPTGELSIPVDLTVEPAAMPLPEQAVAPGAAPTSERLSAEPEPLSAPGAASLAAPAPMPVTASAPAPSAEPDSAPGAESAAGVLTGPAPEPVAEPAAAPLTAPASAPSAGRPVESASVPLAEPVPAPESADPDAQPVAAAQQAGPVAVAPVAEPAGARVATVPTQPPAPAVEGVGEPVRRTPWWAVGVLGVLSILLIVVNWPGSPESRPAWEQSDFGWGAYRSPADPFIVAAFVMFLAVAALAVSGRRSIIALGVAGGAGLSLALSGVDILTGGIAADEFVAWAVTTLLAVAAVVVALVAARLHVRVATPVSRAGVALIALGGALMVAASSLTYDGVAFLTVSRGAGALDTTALVMVALSAVGVGDPTARRLLAAAAATALAVAGLGYVPGWITDLPAGFALGVSGSAAALAGLAVALAGRRPRVPVVDDRPVRAVWFTALILGGCALALLFLNGWALGHDHYLWYDSSQGSSQLSRRPYDGTLYAALAALVASILTVVGGRLTSFALGVVAGVGALFATAGVVIFGGGFATSTVVAWAGSLAAAAVMLGGAVVIAGRLRVRRPAVLPAVLVGFGFLVLVAAQFTDNDSSSSAAYYGTALIVLLALAPGGLATLAVMAAGGGPHRVAVGAAVAYALLMAFAAVYPIVADTADRYFAVMLAGHLVLVMAVVVDLLMRRRRGTADEVSPST